MATQPMAKEVRIGLVMYGGVSLAIYINGVAQEFFHSVRGRGAYSLIKALTDSDIVVDVVSGTSAGGINGIFLGYALANGRDFTSTAELWRKHGDIRALLRPPNGGGDTTNSILNSEGFFQPRLEEAFDSMNADMPPGPIDSTVREIDLFVTGTDVDGRTWSQFDDAGNLIHVKDHRCVFLLKYRAGRKNEFGMSDGSPVDPIRDRFDRVAIAKRRALAKLSRITSCFPVAFAPVLVGGFDGAGPEHPDYWLRRWGKLDKPSCFLDGGVVDNKPFTYTLGEIFHRTANREVDRKLFYVEPDPETFDLDDRGVSNPNVAEAAFAALSGIPGYETIADDLKLLAEHNSKVETYGRFVEELEAHLPSEPDPLYERTKKIALVQRALALLFVGEGSQPVLRDVERGVSQMLAAAFDKISAGDTGQLLVMFDVDFRMRRLFRTIYKIGEELYRTSANRRPNDSLSQVYLTVWAYLNRQVECLEIVRAQMESLIARCRLPWRTRAIELLSRERQGLPHVEKDWEDLWSEIGGAMRYLLANDGLAEFLPPPATSESGGAPNPREPLQAPAAPPHAAGSSDPLRELNRVLSDRVSSAPRAIPPSDGRGSALVTIDAYELTLLGCLDDDDRVKRAYLDFELVDSRLLMLELVAGINEKDVIETVRISPKDAVRGFSAKGLSDKVSGDALHHFGGFFKRSWRANDILWGRLDGACQIVETLLSKSRVEECVDSPPGRKRLKSLLFEVDPNDRTRERLKPALSPAVLFKRSGPLVADTLEKWLWDLVDNANWQQAIARFNDMRDLLIEAYQLEIVADGLQTVVSDALEEQSAWNQYRRAAGAQTNDSRDANGAAEPLGWVSAEDLARRDPRSDATSLAYIYGPAGGNVDPLVAVVGAAGVGGGVVERLETRDERRFTSQEPPTRPRHTDLGRFFVNKYNVGAEDLYRDVPLFVLLEILAVALLVTRRCILAVFGPRAARIESNPAYVALVDYPLRAFYGFVQLQRRAPRWKFVLTVGTGLLSLILLVIGLFWFPEIVTPGGKLSAVTLAIFILLPLVLLVVCGWTLYYGYPPGEGPRSRKFRMRIIAYTAALTALPAVAVATHLFTNWNAIVMTFHAFVAAIMLPILAGFGSKPAEWILGSLLLLLVLALPYAPLAAMLYLRRTRRSEGNLEELLQTAFSAEELFYIAGELRCTDVVAGTQVARWTVSRRQAAEAIYTKAKQSQQLKALVSALGSMKKGLVGDFVRGDLALSSTPPLAADDLRSIARDLEVEADLIEELKEASEATDERAKRRCADALLSIARSTGKEAAMVQSLHRLRAQLFEQVVLEWLTPRELGALAARLGYADEAEAALRRTAGLVDRGGEATVAQAVYRFARKHGKLPALTAVMVDLKPGIFLGFVAPPESDPK